MEKREAIKQVDAAAPARQDAWDRCVCDYINPVVDRVKRRPLFQKVIIANTLLISCGAIIGLYMEQKYFQGGAVGFLILFVISGVSLSILTNYLLVKLAFRPLDDVSETMKAIRAGHRGIRVPEITDDPQVEELSRSLNAMLDSIERQRKRAAASVIQAQEEERKRIARELHDETSQSLTGLVIGIRMVEEMPAATPEVRERLANISDLAHATLNEVHTMAIRLRPSVLDDLGLPAALRSYVKEFSENAGIKVDLQLLAMAERLSPEMETVLYRVVQEALTNVARHSAAANCRVSLQRRDGKIEAEITDDGKGFDSQTVMTSDHGGGLGLHGMKERIELVGGSMWLESRPGEGSKISLEVPIQPKEGVW
ncbi:MAG: sensor histidine kinase [Thermoleophilia bacterium]